MLTEKQREYNKVYARKWRSANPERARKLSTANSRKRRSENPEREREYQRRYERARRQKIVDFLGNACATCGMHGERAGFLDIDHVNNDGGEERGRATHEYVILAMKACSEQEVRDKYQLLCPNCHRNKTLDALDKAK